MTHQRTPTGIPCANNSVAVEGRSVSRAANFKEKLFFHRRSEFAVTVKVRERKEAVTLGEPPLQYGQWTEPVLDLGLSLLLNHHNRP
jgi:hypothetical protein